MHSLPTPPSGNRAHSQASYSQSNKQAMRNPWFLAILAIIAVFLIVNVIFVVFAIVSDPGLVAEDYYEKGRDYEKNIETQLAARNNLKWETKTEFPQLIYLNKPDTYRFTAVDSRGVAIRDADVKLILYRPSNSNADFVKQIEQIAPGLYQTELDFPLPGIWDINLKVTDGENVYHQAQRITVLIP